MFVSTGILLPALM